MIVATVLAVLLVGGLVALLVGGLAARLTSLAALAVSLGYSLSLALGTERHRAELDLDWMPALGVRLHLAAGGLSSVLLVLTMVLGILAVLASWREIDRRVGLYHLNLLLCLAGVAGVFVAEDLLLFYFFWELMLVPMFLLIRLWGHEDRARAAMKFALFTQAGGLCLLVAILALAFIRARHTGILSFDAAHLATGELTSPAAWWIMLGFFAGFAVKLPAVPLHSWLADAHTEAPTGGSVLLAGLLLKTGAYGLLRFAVPLFPSAARQLAPVALALGVAGILYGAVLAIGQRDLKRLVAYTSISHMGFVLVGIYSFTPRGNAGAVLQIVCHALSTGGLFMVVGSLQERTGTRDLTALGGLWPAVPRLAVVATVLAMASLGLPGLGNFAAEVLVLLGAFEVSVPVAVLSSLVLVLSTIYALRIVQKAFQGSRPPAAPRFADLGVREVGSFAVVIALLLWLGVRPNPLITTADRPLATAEAAP